jgi:DNA-binding CsgD family transcriptional regulator
LICINAAWSPTGKVSPTGLPQPRKVDIMTPCHPVEKIAEHSNVLAFVQPRRGLDMSYDRALARQEAELREALARIQGLRRQYDETPQLAESGVVPALFAAREAAARRVASLTTREREVLDLVLAGRASKIIAWELGISQRTVENHRAAIMKKTESKSIPALARLAIAAAWNGTSQPAGEDQFAIVGIRTMSRNI